MLWYGYIYYFLFLILMYILVSYHLQAMEIFSYFRFESISNLLIYILAVFISFAVVSLLVLFYILDYFSFLKVSYLPDGSDILLFNYYSYDYLVSTVNLNLNLISVYYFPFIYIFILITILSVIFCLNYNLTELTAFMLYCVIILFAGYVLFFTDSLILFFLAYEFLLVPSFFILHNFAKTRKCVEAALLMFFWTQFGALFIIFAFLYLFFTCETSTFSTLSELVLSRFELNFIFTCLIIGFGVKLPIWPFYGWLPKAHVEASTNFSIFLSGVLVKFAFFGLLKCLLTLQLEPQVQQQQLLK